jgi:hypothetical protein
MAPLTRSSATRVFRTPALALEPPVRRYGVSLFVLYNLDHSAPVYPDDIIVLATGEDLARNGRDGLTCDVGLGRCALS